MGDTYTAAQLREMLRRDDVDLPALEHAGLIGEDELDLLLSIKQNHPEGRHADIYEDVLERAVSHRVRESVEKDHVGAMSHAAGLSSDRAGLGDLRAFEALEELWSDYPTFQMYVYGPLPPEGPVGVGKTDFSYLMAEIGRRVYPDLEVASNTPSDEFGTIQSWTGVEEWLQSTDGKKLFILDEAAQVLQFEDMNAGKVVSKLLKLIRKYDGNIILIGHTGRDVPRDVRRQLLVARKESKTKATIGTGLNEENEEIRVAKTYLRINNIPETKVEYDTLDTADFDFDADVDSDSSPNDDEAPMCEAETNDGNPCPATAEYPSDDPRYCINHRHLADD